MSPYRETKFVDRDFSVARGLCVWCRAPIVFERGARVAACRACGASSDRAAACELLARAPAAGLVGTAAPGIGEWLRVALACTCVLALTVLVVILWAATLARRGGQNADTGLVAYGIAIVVYVLVRITRRAS